MLEFLGQLFYGPKSTVNVNLVVTIDIGQLIYYISRSLFKDKVLIMLQNERFLKTQLVFLREMHFQSNEKEKCAAILIRSTYQNIYRTQYPHSF
ncbi:CLUMA_CG018565, isoform A [Clunio marinus]|uniref:CLUMA_CG018565, isoform A n=1 Tax=Clunio marinus TaxID=568069 RepID=A0A1J1IXR6_9DIPT|nr:CLUMA_CG018565, isoform A [Clunio marinus]